MGDLLKIVFAGSPEFAATILKTLLKTNHQIVGVYTQPDRPAGRGRAPKASAVKRLIQGLGPNHGTAIHQPQTLKTPEIKETLARLLPDLMVVAAYGVILPKDVLETPRFGCINVHASLLPRWRGAAPIQRAIIAGDEETGVSIMQMDEGLDTGDILCTARCLIYEADTAQSLGDRLASLGAQTLIHALDELGKGTLQPLPQDHAKATYAQRVSKPEAVLAWHRSAKELARRVRAFNPWPVAHTTLTISQGKKQNAHWTSKYLRIWEAMALDQSATAAPGTLMACSTSGLDIATGSGVLRLLRIQLPGAKPVSTMDFLNAHTLRPGQVLGEISTPRHDEKPRSGYT